VIRIVNCRVRVVPQIYLALEAVRLGEIEAREAFTDLVLDAEILVDDAELQKIKALPEMQQSLGGVTAPAGPTFKGSDWRAKGSEMRNLQWKQKPVIDYIANTYKDAVMQAIAAKMTSIPGPWRQVLLASPAYRLETKGLQLSPTEDKKWKSVFVQVTLGLGSYEDETGFLGKLGQEFEQAATNNQVQEAADGIVWKSTLSGLETFFKSMDPFSGTKPSSHEIQGHPVARWKDYDEDPSASEPGYDLHVKEGMLDQMQNALDEKLVDILGIGIKSLKVSDDGVFVFEALPPEPATEPEQMADDVEEPIEPGDQAEPPAEPV
jgi:hypothetical protein